MSGSSQNNINIKMVQFSLFLMIGVMGEMLCFLDVLVFQLLEKNVLKRLYILFRRERREKF